ncbi:hypothetical protein [Bradyrhizobium sp.]|uniref:hypothetical protein n=1 Tax=Bradyrhizobium sp. TaxID=376 RepID=UPI0040377EF0
MLPVRTASGALLSVAAVGSLLVLAQTGAHAQWWRSAPADFEDCAALAAKAPTKDETTAKLSDCNAKFAGRRKPGGGYTYFDFMQNRNFDIAGPNPTPEEQKKIDEEYIAYLERERRNTAAAALAAKQREQQEQQQQRKLQQVSLRSDEKVPVPVASPAKQPPRTRSVTGCVKGTFSCDWPRLSGGINDIKKLFSGTPNKGKRS